MPVVIIRPLIKIIAFAVFLASFATTAFADHPVAAKGVLDLRAWNFQLDGNIELSGEWEFYWNEFLISEQLELSQSKQDYISLPGTWLDKVHEGQPLDEYGYATFRLMLLLPDDPTTLMFFTKRVQSAFTMYVDGVEAIRTGKVGTDAESTSSRRQRDHVVFRNLSGQTEIILHVANYDSFNGGGLLSAVKVGNPESIKLLHSGEFSQDVFLFGALICLGLFLIIIHIGRPEIVSYPILYTLSFTTAIHVITVNSTVLEIYQNIPWYWVERVAFISAVLLPAFFYQFLSSLFGAFFGKVSFGIVWGLTISEVVFIIFYPGPLPSLIIPWLGFILLVAVVASIKGLGQAIGGSERGALVIVFATLVAVVGGINDILNVEGVIQSFYIAPYSILIMLMLFASNLARLVRESFLQSEELMNAIQPVRECVAVFDADNNLKFWNEAYKDFLGEKFEHLLNYDTNYLTLLKTMVYSGDLNDAVGCEEEYIALMLERHEAQASYFEIRRQNHWYLVRKDGTPSGGTLTLITDITEQKDKEEKLRKALGDAEQANKVKTEFLANMSHELRTPLNAIIGFAQVIDSEIFGSIDKKYKEYTGHINSSGQHLLGLITNILDLALTETGEIKLDQKRLNLHDLTANLVEEHSVHDTQNKITFEAAENSKELFVSVDQERFAQLLGNLLENAQKHSQAEEAVRVCLSVGEDSVAFISVEDKGIGIPPEQLIDIQEKFNQVRAGHLQAHEGLGVGLTLAKSLAELHGGNLSLESELNVGTKVTLSLPISE